MKEKNDYNGWTNYATWRINLEILGDMEFEEEVTPEQLEDIVEVIFYDTPQGFVEDYARAFLNYVNYHEIANHINDEININK